MSTVSCNGAIFAYGLKLGKEVIVSFDIATKVFTLIPWPPLSGDPSINLTVYEDKLALLITSAKGASSKVDLGVIEEDMGSSGERGIWIKKFTSDPYPWEFIPWTIWRNEIVVFGTEIGGGIEKNERYLCLFNVTTNEFKTIVITRYNLLDFINYVESLYQLSSMSLLINLSHMSFLNRALVTLLSPSLDF
ncbi:hypothetical protein K1719_001722 [Acacia pycnantha]|nr:hypothetical protein K1719_001722 [Acacia pycnantha]